MNNQPPLRFAFFGTPDFAVTVLDELERAGYVPAVVVTREDKPAGRKMLMTPPPVKVWAEKRGISVSQPRTLKTDGDADNKTSNILADLKNAGCDIFIVVAYGRIIPQNILDIPRFGSINVHPSLLPKLRGPSPIESAILSKHGENETGVTLMLLDAEMDHGPILAQKKLYSDNLEENKKDWPPYADVLESTLAHLGGVMLADILPDYIEGKLQPIEQDHSQATFCKKIEKQDGLLDVGDMGDVDLNVRKVRAFCIWPKAYYFHTNNDGSQTRIIVTKAREENDKFVIEKIIPEGKAEMDYKNSKYST